MNILFEIQKNNYEITFQKKINRKRTTNYTSELLFELPHSDVFIKENFFSKKNLPDGVSLLIMKNEREKKVPNNKVNNKEICLKIFVFVLYPYFPSNTRENFFITELASTVENDRKMRTFVFD